MPFFSLCPIHTSGPFSQYLLPQAASFIAAEDPFTVALGVVSGQYAAGAGCAQLQAGKAVLLSLFIDPAIRGQGAAGLLLDALAKECAARGAGQLTANYVLEGQALAAMDALFRARGAEPYTVPEQTFRIDSAQFHDMPLIRAAFHPSFRPASAVRRFCDISPALLDALAKEPAIPDYLKWDACRGRVTADMSLGWVENGRITAYTLAGESPDGGCAQVATVRLPCAAPSSILALVRALINLSFYRFGGDFPFYTATVTPESYALVQRLSGGQYTEYTERSAVITLRDS